MKEQAFLQLLEELGIPPAVDWGTVDSKLQQQCVEDMRYIAVSAKSRFGCSTSISMSTYMML